MNKRKNIIVFFLIAIIPVIAIASAIWFSGIGYPSSLGNVGATVCMLCPMISTLTMQAINKEPLFKNLGISWHINRWWFVGWLTVPVIVLITLGFSLLMPDANFTLESALMNKSIESLASNGDLSAQGIDFTPQLLLIITLISGMFAGCTINALLAFGEEAGWRGYLIHQLKGKSFLKAALIIGALWGLWHSPLIFLGHNYPAHPLLGIVMMTIFCILFTPMIQYFRIKSGSVLVAAIIHGTINALSGVCIIVIDNFNVLLCGVCGLAGMITLLLIDMALYFFDRFVTKDHIFTSAI